MIYLRLLSHSLVSLPARNFLMLLLRSLFSAAFFLIWTQKLQIWNFSHTRKSSSRARAINDAWLHARWQKKKLCAVRSHRSHRLMCYQMCAKCNWLVCQWTTVSCKMPNGDGKARVRENEKEFMHTHCFFFCDHKQRMLFMEEIKFIVESSTLTYVTQRKLTRTTIVCSHLPLTASRKANDRNCVPDVAVHHRCRYLCVWKCR